MCNVYKHEVAVIIIANPSSSILRPKLLQKRESLSYLMDWTGCHRNKRVSEKNPWGGAVVQVTEGRQG